MKHPRIRRRISSIVVVIALAVLIGCPSAMRAQQADKSVPENVAPVQAKQQPDSATQPYSSSLAGTEELSSGASENVAQAQDNGAPQLPAKAPAADDQQAPRKPVGAAAAPPEGAAGVTAARPAGAVIAPAKQRRVRTILIRVGLLVGAGVALGTVMALSHATPSQPQ